MKQNEAQEQLEAVLAERKITYDNDSLTFLMKSKFEEKPVYLFRFIETDGTMRVALSGDFTVIIDEYSYQYIRGSLGPGGVSSQKEKLLQQSIINYCIGKYLVSEYSGVYERADEIDFNAGFDSFFGDGNRKYEIFTQNCIQGKNELQYYGTTGFTRFTKDMIVESVRDLQTLALENGQYAVVGTFVMKCLFDSESVPKTEFTVTCEMNHGFVLELVDGGYREKLIRRFSPSPHRWNGGSLLETYMGLISGPFSE